MDQGDLVVVALKADLGSRDVVEDDQIGVLLRELDGPARSPAARSMLGGKADDRLPRVTLSCQRGEDVSVGSR